MTAKAKSSVGITPGHGATIATEHVNNREHQVMMLATPNGELVEHRREDLFPTLIHLLPVVGQEARVDDPLGGDLYHGRATDGALETDPVWEVVRFYRTAGKVTRVRYRAGLRWDQRTLGWT